MQLDDYHLQSARIRYSQTLRLLPGVLVFLRYLQGSEYIIAEDEPLPKVVVVVRVMHGVVLSPHDGFTVAPL